MKKLIIIGFIFLNLNILFSQRYDNMAVAQWNSANIRTDGTLWDSVE